MTRCSATIVEGDRCKKSTLSGSKLCWIHEEKIICGICLNESVKKSTNNIETSCGHVFCKKCIFTWIIPIDEPSCPTCRQNVGKHVISSSDIWGEQEGILIYMDVTYYLISKSFFICSYINLIEVNELELRNEIK
jgi:hypothetical protein